MPSGKPRGTYDVAVEATSRADGLRALAPGGVCTAVGYYLATGTRLPLMRVYATDATLRLGVSHARALIPHLLAFIAETGFEAERVTSLTAHWDDAPDAYVAKTTKVVLARDPPSTMNTLHHPHLMASDLDATIAFWRDGLGGQVIADLDFRRRLQRLMRLGYGRLHLYDQPPFTNERSTVHHLGVQTDELEHLVGRLRDMGVSVTDVRDQPGARYAMAEGPDGLLIELFQPDLDELAPELRDHFHPQPLNADPRPAHI